MNPIVVTLRLTFLPFSLADAPHILRLLNDPAFIQNIGDKQVRTVEDARAYLTGGPLQSYSDNGFGLWKVIETKNNEFAGMCGLIKRDSLPCVDIGYAFLPQYRGAGIGTEAALACKQIASTVYGLSELCGISNAENTASICVLKKLGMKHQKTIRLPQATADVELYWVSLAGQ